LGGNPPNGDTGQSSVCGNLRREQLYEHGEQHSQHADEWVVISLSFHTDWLQRNWQMFAVIFDELDRLFPRLRIIGLKWHMPHA
jgi:hypothetical protein